MTEARKPPDIDPDKLDFSVFHPLDHHPWQCWQRNAWQPIYGKTWTHLKYDWEFRRRGQLRAATLCRIGIGHRYGMSWKRQDDEMVEAGEHCCFCYRDKPA